MKHPIKKEKKDFVKSKTGKFYKILISLIKHLVRLQILGNFECNKGSSATS